MKPSSKIAIKYIKSKRYNYLPSLSFLTSFFGIFISVFALITVISVMEGFKQEFQKNIVGLRPHIKVYFIGEDYKIKQFTDYKQKSELISPLVKNVSGGLSGEAILSDTSGKRLTGVIINSLETGGFYSRDLLKKHIKGEFKEGNFITIGSELAFNLGVQIGDEVNLISPQFRKTPFGNIPIHKTYIVSGIFNVGMHFYDSSFVFLNLPQGEVFLAKNGAEYLEVMVDDFNNLNEIKRQIFSIFGKNVRITDWKTENKGFIDAINLQKSVMFFILFMFLILAGFIMFSGLSSLVMQKNKTTAILRTLGFSKLQVALTFFQVGMFTTIPAIFGGMALGSIFVLNLEKIKNYLEQQLNATIFDGAYYFLSYIPSHIEPKIILQVLFLSFILCFTAIIIPSLRAIKTEPIDALRWE